MNAHHSDVFMQNKIFIGLALATGFMLLIPFIAMQISAEVHWQLNDFIIAGLLLFGMGSLFICSARHIKSTSSRAIAGVTFLFLTLYIWAELAVGIFTNWGS